ncbi:hypothetical protein J7L48_11040 [bacterium]|nr:hypothetical protein [bacterium]
MKLNIIQLNEFKKDFKKLKKRFKTLDEDLDLFIDTQLKMFHILHIDNNAIVRISNLGIVSSQIYKVRKFACKSLKGKGARSGIRIIYAFYEEENKIELIEIYFKQDKANEDKERIKKYYKK